MTRRAIYLELAVIGAIVPWIFFFGFFRTEGLAGDFIGSLFVNGAAGSGKSRLVYQAIESMSSASGPLVLAGREVGTGGRAYQAFLEIVHDLLGVGEMEVDGRRARIEEELQRLLPDTPGVVPHLAEFLLAGLRPDDASGFTKDALLSGFANLLRNTAAERPLVLVVDRARQW